MATFLPDDVPMTRNTQDTQDTQDTAIGAGEPGPPPDPRPRLERSLRTAAEVMDHLREDNAALPSPCGEWNALDVARHLVAVADRITALGQGRDPNPLPTMAEGLEPADCSPALDSATGRALEAWADDSVLGAMVTVPWGRVPGAVAAAIYSAEVLVHTWDLARALGVEPSWSTDDLEAALGDVMRGLPPEPRGGEIPFGPPTEVGTDATAADRLAAWAGRSV